jgi:hypothetical protein
MSAEKVLPFLVSTLALSVIITWVFNTTRKYHAQQCAPDYLYGVLNTWPGLLATDIGSSALA